jgi:hypothetical protein
MQIVEEIKQFKLWKNFLFLSKTDGIYVLLKSESLYKVFNYKNPFIILHEKYLHISNSNEENEQEFLIDSDLNVKEKYSSDLNIVTERLSYEIKDDLNLKKSTLSFFYNEIHELIKKIDFDYIIHFILITNKRLIFRKEFCRNIITAVDLIEFKVAWTYSLTQYPKYIDDFGDEREIEIDGEIKVFGTQLLVPCYNHIFLCLDIQTGGLLWENKNTKGYHPVYYNQSVCFMTTKQFLELDIVTGKTIRDIDVSKTFIEHQLEINATWHETVIYKDKIYRVYSQEFFIAIMNYNTLEYEGKIDIKKSTKKGWQIGDMKIHENKLYVLEWVENSKNLHIIDI